MHDAHPLVVDAIVDTVIDTCNPLGQDGFIAGHWAQVYDTNLRQACARMDASVRPAVEARLLAMGVMTRSAHHVGQALPLSRTYAPGICPHGLSLDACPSACCDTSGPFPEDA